MTSQGPGQALRLSAADPEAFADFYNSQFNAILAYLARRVHDPEVALDLAAETFAQAFLDRHRFRGSTTEEASAWVHRIGKRKLSRYLRRHRVERHALERLQVRELPHLDEVRRARIDELGELAGLRSVLREELSQLSGIQREAVRLRVLEEHSYAEIAQRLAISEQTARARVSRALRRLAATLDDEELTAQEART